MIHLIEDPYDKAMTILQVAVSAFVHNNIPKSDVALAFSDNLAAVIVSQFDNKEEALAFLSEMVERIENTIIDNYDGNLNNSDIPFDLN